jgi:basic membrane protein A
VARGQFRSGAVVYGVKEKGVGLSPMRFTRKDVPDSTMKLVRMLERMIAQGKLKPPYDEATFRRFKPPSVPTGVV